MREILFRGQTRRHGETLWMNGEKVPNNWVYGGIFQGAGDFSVIYGATKEDFSGEDIKKHIVYTDTVGQFIGLLDRNGKRIFEGDIVEHHVQGDILVNRGVVNWDARNGRWAHQLNTMNPCFYMHNPEAVEVIGNIHDNPELLEVEE